MSKGVLKSASAAIIWPGTGEGIAGGYCLDGVRLDDQPEWRIIGTRQARVLTALYTQSAKGVGLISLFELILLIHEEK